MSTPKTCIRCGETRDSTEFHKQARSADGLNPYCKPCARELNREWRAAHPGYGAARTSKRAEYMDKWRCANRARINRLAREYREAHPDMHREAVARRRRHMRGAHADSHKAMVAWRTLCMAAGCEYCAADAEHLDHMVSLADGGKHTVRNTTGACAHCNLTKSVRSYPDGWLPC